MAVWHREEVLLDGFMHVHTVGHSKHVLEKNDVSTFDMWSYPLLAMT